MAGNLAIPNTFAALSGTVAVSKIDDNFTTVRDYVNNREIALGLLSARPSASVAGRLYFATDSNGGQLFEDNGSAWTALTGGIAATTGGYRVSGLTGVNTPATPTTKYDLAADLVVARNPSTGGILVKANTGTLTCDTGLTGPAANGRDQAGALTTPGWFHFYLQMKDDGTTATTVSETAPPTGPTLTSGYTSWAYAGAVYHNGTRLVASHQRGSWVAYDGAQPALTNGAATTQTSVSVAALVPPNALAYTLQGGLGVVGSSAGDIAVTPEIRLVTGVAWWGSSYTLQGFNAAHNFGFPLPDLTLPNIGQAFFYLWTLGAGASSPALTLNVGRYQVPNGGE